MKYKCANCVQNTKVQKHYVHLWDSLHSSGRALWLLNDLANCPRTDRNPFWKSLCSCLLSSTSDCRNANSCLLISLSSAWLSSTGYMNWSRCSCPRCRTARLASSMSLSRSGKSAHLFLLPKLCTDAHENKYTSPPWNNRNHQIMI